MRVDSGRLTMRQWRHEPPAPNFWAKKLALHSDSVQIFEVINLYNRTVQKHTHFRTTFSMPECTKTHLQQCRISKFFRGRTPGPPGEGREGTGRGREGKRREGKRRPLASGPQNHNPPLGPRPFIHRLQIGNLGDSPA